MPKLVPAESRAYLAVVLCVLLLCVGPRPSIARESDSRDDYLLHNTHLPDGTMQSRLALGQRFFDGISNGSLAADGELFRWGITERVNLAFPFVASYLALDSPSERVVVAGGLQSVGLTSSGEFITYLTARGAYEYLPSPDVVWTWAAVARHFRVWETSVDGLGLGLSLNRAQTFGDRWIVGAGIRLFNSTQATLGFSDDISSITIGGTGGLGRPLVQFRVSGGFHLYVSSNASLVVHEPLTNIHGHFVHQHLGGFNWYY